jgi:hypothetical protein
VCQMSLALYSERITVAALSLFPINSLRNQVTSSAWRWPRAHWPPVKAWPEGTLA